MSSSFKSLHLRAPSYLVSELPSVVKQEFHPAYSWLTQLGIENHLAEIVTQPAIIVGPQVGAVAVAMMQSSNS